LAKTQGIGESRNLVIANSLVSRYTHPVKQTLADRLGVGRDEQVNSFNGGLTMRALFGLFLALTVAVVFLTGVDGAQDKEVTIMGKITCAKCDLKLMDKCATVVVEKGKDGKNVVYYFDTDSHKKNHSDICTTPKDGSVTGTVSDKDGKKTIKAKEVKYGK
jgi:hypothetical protein